jgi:glycolate oxidase FAD binding subunit
MTQFLEQLSEQIRAAANARRPLRIRGGDTKQFYGRPVDGDTLELSPWSGVIEYEPSELVITVKSGTPLLEVEQVLAEKGQMLAFEPPHFGPQATVGGVLATGLAGPARAYRGSVRDFVLGLTVVDGKGDVLKFGGKVIKNVAGYDVSRLMVGANGTLGVITEASFKVLPRPTSESTLMFQLDEASAIRTMNEWAAKPLPLSATCFSENRLWVRLSGSESGINAARAKLGGESLSNADRFWASVREQTIFETPDSHKLWRVSVPATTPSLDIRARQVIEWGGALRWFSSVELAAAKVRETAARAGGHATLFRGGEGDAEVFHPLPAGVARLHQRLKHTFDPSGVLNPGRMYSGL